MQWRLGTLVGGHGMLVLMTLLAAARGAIGAEAVDAYGDPLPAQAVARIGTTRFRQGSTVRELIFSPDGKRLAAAGRTLRIYEAASGKLLGEIDGQDSLLTNYRVCFSPDGELIAGITGKAEIGYGTNVSTPVGTGIQFWDARTLKPVRQVEVPPIPPANPGGKPGRYAITCLAFSRDGKMLAVGMMSGKALLLNPQTGAILRQLEPKGPYSVGEISKLVFSPDGKYLGAIHSGGWALPVLWEVQSGAVLVQGDTRVEMPATAVGFSPDGSAFRIVRYPDRVLHVELPNGKVPDVSDRGAERVDGLLGAALSPDGKWVAIARGGQRPAVGWPLPYWEAATTLELIALQSREVTVLHDKGHDILAVAFSPDSKLVAAAGADDVVDVWDVGTKKAIAPLSDHGAPVHTLAVSADGRLLASGDADGLISVRSLETGKQVARLTGHANAVVAMAFVGEGKSLASYSRDKTFRVWDLASQTQAHELKVSGDDRPVFASMAISKNGKRAIVVDQKAVHGWALDKTTLGGMTPDELAGLGPRMEFYASNVAPDWDRFQGPALWQDFRRADGQTNVPLNPQAADAPTLKPYYCAALSPDGRRLVSAVDDVLDILDADTYEQIKHLAPRDVFDKARPICRFRMVAFSPDGKRIVAVQDVTPSEPSHGRILRNEASSVIRVYNAESGLELASLQGQAGPVQAMAFGASGRILFTGAADGTVVAWDLATAKRAPTNANQESAKLWEQVIAPPGDAAGAAMSLLAQRPADAVRLVKAFMAGTVDDAEAAEAITNLGSDAFAARIKAETWIAAERGRRAGLEIALLKQFMLESRSDTVRTKCYELLKGLRDQQTEDLRTVRRLIHLLRWTGSEDAKAVLKQMAALPEQRGGSEAEEALKQIAAGTHRHDLVEDRAEPSEATPLPMMRFAIPEPPKPAAPVVPLQVDAPGVVPTRQADLPPKAVVRLGTSAAGVKLGGIAVAGDGKSVVIGSSDGMVQIMRVADQKAIRTIKAHDGEVSDVALSPDGRLLAAVSRMGSTRIFEAATGRQIRELIDDRKPSFSQPERYAVAFSPSGKAIVVMNAWSNQIRVWDVAGRELGLFWGHGQFHDTPLLSFSQDGRRLFASVGDGTLVVDAIQWAYVRGDPNKSSVPPAPRAQAVSGDGKWLACFVPSGELTFGALVDLATMEQIVGLRRSGQPIASGERDTTPDGPAMAPYRPERKSGSERTCRAAVFSADSRRLAMVEDAQSRIAAKQESGAYAQVLRVFEVGTGEEILTANGHASAVCAMRFDGGGKRLFTASEDGTVLGWDLPPASSPTRAPPAQNAGTAKAELAKAFEQLFNRDSAVAWEGTRVLLAQGQPAVPFIRSQYFALRAETDVEVAHAIRELANPATRESAGKRLWRMESRPERALVETLLDVKTPAEVQTECRNLLWLRGKSSVERKRVLRVLWILHEIGGRDANAMLRVAAERLPDQYGGSAAQELMGPGAADAGSGKAPARTGPVRRSRMRQQDQEEQ